MALSHQASTRHTGNVQNLNARTSATQHTYTHNLQRRCAQHATDILNYGFWHVQILFFLSLLVLLRLRLLLLLLSFGSLDGIHNTHLNIKFYALHRGETALLMPSLICNAQWKCTGVRRTNHKFYSIVPNLVPVNLVCVSCSCSHFVRVAATE